MTDLLANWHQEGITTHVSVRGVRRGVFTHVSGSGSPLVLLHGVPASSFEWAAVTPLLARQHTVITFDFLGFGASAKPKGHRYSVFEQADLVQELLVLLGVTSASVVAYDYGAIVASELLARAGNRQFDVPRCLFLNAGIYPEFYRPTLVQRALLWPGIGQLLARATTERVFLRTWAKLYSTEHPLDPALGRLHYRALRAGSPDPDLPRQLLHYIPERARNRDRLERALKDTDARLSFLWGMQDPVSGRAVAAELRRRQPQADLVEYPDLGHCPHIEDPERVAADILHRTMGTGR